MGNETSSVKIHSLLSADDIKRLRAGFPVRVLYITDKKAGVENVLVEHSLLVINYS